MKYLTTLISAVLIFGLSTSNVQAQDDWKDRVKRISSIQGDIRILEGVLQEIFKTRWDTKEMKIQVLSGSLSLGNDNDITGSYVDDYGVVFTIPGPSHGFMINIDGEKNSHVFLNGVDSEDTKITEKTVVKRIAEFLDDYGSTIDQLGTDERITVIFNAKLTGNYNFIRIGASEENQKEKSSLPSLYVSVTKTDLERVRKGTISKSQFNDRLEIGTIDSEKRDLKIMGNIIKTTFEETNNDVFEIRGEVSHAYIKNMGALFYLDTSSGSTFLEILKPLKGKALTGKNLSTVYFDSVKTALDSLSKTPLRLDSLKIAPLNLDSLRTKLLKLNNVSVNTFNFSDDENERKPSKEESEKAFQQFVQLLKETVVDYGRTLKSVQSDELVFVRAYFPSLGNGLSKEVNMQIKKSMLEAYDAGKITRDEAIEQVKHYELSQFRGGERSYTIPNVSVQN